MEYFLYLWCSLLSFHQPLRIFRMVAPHKGRCFLIQPNWHIPNHLMHLYDWFMLAYHEFCLGNSTLRYISIPEISNNLRSCSPRHRIAITRSHMININFFCPSIICRCYNDICNHNVDWDHIAYLVNLSICFFHYSQPDKHKVSSCGGNAI